MQQHYLSNQERVDGKAVSRSVMSANVQLNESSTAKSSQQTTQSSLRKQRRAKGERANANGAGGFAKLYLSSNDGKKLLDEVPEYGSSSKKAKTAAGTAIHTPNTSQTRFNAHSKAQS